jgi:hypothetical protein
MYFIKKKRIYCFFVTYHIIFLSSGISFGKGRDHICHDRPGLPQVQAREWLGGDAGRDPAGHIRWAKPELSFIELLEFKRGL